MRGILLVTKDLRGLTRTQSVLVREGHRTAMTSPDEDSILESAGKLTPEVVVADCRDCPECASNTRRLLKTECNLKELLVVALVGQGQMLDMDWSGVDDFIIEPCNPDELVCRLKLLLWRTKKVSSDQIIKISGLEIDMQNYEVSVDGIPIELTFKEYELLRFLATHRGRVFTRESLLDHVWGYDYYGGTRTVDVHIRRLRAKLEPSCESFIETVRNVGYRFTA